MKLPKILKNPFLILAAIILLIGAGFLVREGLTFKITNVHEHIQKISDAKKLLKINEEFGIEKTIMLGSPEQTFYPTKIKNQEFTRYDENNAEILRIAEKYPDQFIAFCVPHQEDPRKIEKIAECVQKGAKGIKLFSGHGSFHTIPLNDPSLDPFYQYLSANGIPILWHVNSGKYLNEFKAVLAAYPNLRIICAHYCLLSNNLPTLSGLMDAYPNLYTDASWGSPDVIKAGLSRMSKNREAYLGFFEKYQDRIMWGTDFVITRSKSERRILENFQANFDMLEKSSFQYLGKTYQGLNLPRSILKKVYSANYERFMTKL